ncbi:hypothetical protein [Parerythrobacter jejuensis]|uniref:Uncharacterized protein n=1 Tax=Parerythrobacter jejuensis TaxID=795812 RepID=A0A845AXX4_9SPHN|nr:hypothetical protein [Parerythrobacter jejuensis]MXP31367.1 hypothetical protein [Parerythrobacter jejuensis]MXP34127.1 hypothetical protein [Parerythrobacter jejuensis]
MSFLSRFNPAPGIRDFWTEFTRPQPYRVPILLASVLIPATIIYIMIPESERVAPQPPDVVYITTFAPDRTDEEIVASNLANQERKEALAARRAAIEERKRELYRTLGAATGMDVEEIEREAEAERAREDAQREAQTQRRLEEAGIEPGA